ncbi:MAG: VCBS repeat-containing protein [Planctomycetes bacterium]|nr:VCBS repeat-containing protein [Planctomycetota bacterium]
MDRYKVLGFILCLSCRFIAAQSAHIAFGPPSATTLATPTSIRGFFDLDGDGDLDLVTTDAANPQVILFRNDLPIGWTPIAGVPAQATISNVASGDFDGDGDIDLITISTPGVTPGTVIGIHLALGANLFARSDFPSAAVDTRLQVLDLDGDGDLDALVGMRHALVNDGSGVFTAQPPWTIPQASPGAGIQGEMLQRAADLDGDGDIDLLSRVLYTMSGSSGFRSLIRILENQGAFSFIGHELTSRMASNIGLDLVDIDGDGDLDLFEAVTENGGPVTVRSWRQGPGMRFEPGPSRVVTNFINASAVPSGVFINLEDVDADATPDAVLTVSFPAGFLISTNEIQVLRGTPSGFLHAPLANSIPVGFQSHIVDLDFDGRTEIVQSGPSFGPLPAASSVVNVHTNLSGTPPFPLHRLTLTSPNHRRAFLGDPAQESFVVRATDFATGLPVPGLPITIGGASSLGSTSLPITDASGNLVVPATAAATPADEVPTFEAPAALPTWASLHSYRFEVVHAPNPSAGMPFFSIEFEHGGERTVAFLLAADLPLGGPGFIGTAYGPVATSLLAPLPSLSVLDGLGLFTAPDPRAVAAPRFLEVIPIQTPPPPGLTIVLQLYAVDGAMTFPESLVISPARTVTF